MKRIYIFLFVICPLLSGICEAQWVQMNNGMGNQSGHALVYIGDNIFAGASSGVYLSTNNGESWTQTSLTLVTRSLAVNGNNIFAGTNGMGVYLSTNNGTNWTQTSLNNITVISLAVNGNNIFAGTTNPGNGVYLSTNNGTTWNQTPLNNRVVNSLAINGNNIFAGTNQNGIYLSTNNGTNWTQTSLNNITVISLAVNGNNIFAGTYNTSPPYGVSLSTDNGTTWNQTSLNNQIVFSLAVNGNNIFAGTGNISNGVFVSNNNGTNWIQRNEGLGNVWVSSLCIFNNYIFAGTLFNSVYRRLLGELTGMQPISNEIPNQFSLSQNYPNPFNPATKIQFVLPKSSFAKIVIYDMLGREMETIVNENLSVGTYNADWNAAKYSSGVYFYKIQAGEYIDTKKMILVK